MDYKWVFLVPDSIFIVDIEPEHSCRRACTCLANDTNRFGEMRSGQIGIHPWVVGQPDFLVLE